MLSVNNLSIEFSARPLFSGVSFVVNRKERIGLVGKNGAGKSMLLKIIAGQQSPTGGTVALESGVATGYLPQVMKLEDGCTVMQEVEKAFSEINVIQKRVEALSAEITSREDFHSEEYLKLIDDYSRENERLMFLGSENVRAEAERTLQGLGFMRSDFDRPTHEFSGGWRMRIEIAKILLRHPDIILLDEPTNHLDIESIRWLERFLQTSQAAVILVSHDRAFLNNVCNRTMEIAVGKLTDYRVGYDDFVRLRKERREAQLRAYENQQKEIADIKEFIERFRYKPTKAVQVQSRIKQLEKIVPIEIDEVETEYLHLKFPSCQRSGDFPLICEDVKKSYGKHHVFSGVNMQLRRGEKVAFVGRNGEGKSTLVKCIMSEIDFEGNLRLGHNVSIGYYAQNEAQMLDEALTVFETIDRAAVGEVRMHIRDILGAFMFGGEASDKKVKVLSGGERSRLAMISLLLRSVNFLILDEPTNHLDMRTKDVLKEALLAYNGTVIVVSHDRDFLDGLVSKVYEFGGGKVREHIGGIYDYLRKHDLDLSEVKLQESSFLPKKSVAEDSIQNDGRSNYEMQKQRRREVSKAKALVEKQEQFITSLEEQIQAVEAKLATPQGAADAQLAMQYSNLQHELSEAMAEWERLSEAI